MSRNRAPIKIEIELIEYGKSIGKAIVVAPFADIRAGLTVEYAGNQWLIRSIESYGAPVVAHVVKRSDKHPVLDPVIAEKSK